MWSSLWLLSTSLASHSYTFRTLLSIQQVSLQDGRGFYSKKFVSRRDTESVEDAILFLLVCLYALYGL
jgi:hypothetical protein